MHSLPLIIHLSIWPVIDGPTGRAIMIINFDYILSPLSLPLFLVVLMMPLSYLRSWHSPFGGRVLPCLTALTTTPLPSLR